MALLIFSVILLLLLDQIFKFVLSGGPVERSISLGPIGELRSVSHPIWIARFGRGQKLSFIWICWIVGALGLAVLNVVIPSISYFSWLLIGGSLSHALETSLRGAVCDYVCLRFWPAFNLADAAITIGAIGLTTRILIMLVA